MNPLASPAPSRVGFSHWVLLTVPLVLVLGWFSGQVGSGADSPWFASLEKPAIYPPAATFGIVWSVLYILMGLALALVLASPASSWRVPAVGMFGFQLLLNLAWSPLFFGAHQILNAFLLLIALNLAALATTVLFWRVRRSAGALLLPYVGWVLFATVLNWQFLQLNSGAAGAQAIALVGWAYF